MCDFVILQLFFRIDFYLFEFDSFVESMANESSCKFYKKLIFQDFNIRTIKISLLFMITLRKKNVRGWHCVQLSSETEDCNERRTVMCILIFCEEENSEQQQNATNNMLFELEMLEKLQTSRES